mgnify:CR=1 FL=1
MVDFLESENLEAVALEAEQTWQTRRARHGIGRDAGQPPIVGTEDVGAATGDADHDVEHLFVERVGGMSGFVEHGGPAGAGTGEEELDGFAGLLEFVGDGERVEDAAERFFGIGLWIGEDDDGGFHD